MTTGVEKQGNHREAEQCLQDAEMQGENNSRSVCLPPTNLNLFKNFPETLRTFHIETVLPVKRNMRECLTMEVHFRSI